MNHTFKKELCFLIYYAVAGLMLCMVFLIPCILFMVFKTNGEYSIEADFEVLQWSQTILVMLLPPLLWYKRRFKLDPIADFGFKRFDLKFVLLSVALVTCYMPVMDLIDVLCYNCPMPSFLEPWVTQNKIEAYETASMMMGSLNSVGGWISTVLLVCVATGIAEETMFRGALLKCYTLTSINKHWIAVMIGFLFSLIHFDPIGFLDRWICGIVLVYLVYWSKSIWPSIAVHATNNLLSTLMYHFTNAQDLDPLQPAHLTFSWYYIVLSAVVTYLLFVALYKLRVGDGPEPIKLAE